MRKNLLVILLTAVVFLSAAVLGVATVFRVRGVTVEASVVSDMAEEEAQALKQRLEEVYLKDNILFADKEESEKVIAEFPYFRISGFKKDYPNRIILQVEEGAEVYAVATSEAAEEYYILDAGGTVLEKRESPLNRLDGEQNVIISGLTVTGEKGQPLSGGESFAALLKFCTRMSEKLGGLRSNVLSIKVSQYSPEYCITTRVGVKIYVGAPSEMTVEKAEKAVEQYLALTDEQRLTGRIAIDNKGDVIIASYDSKDFTN